MMFNRRDFLKVIAAALAPLVAKPLPVFVPPREPFVKILPSLDGLYSQLGILPTDQGLSTCEGAIREILPWDGTGYPVVIENVCTFGPTKFISTIYDFNLWNFRHDDHLQPIWQHPEGKTFKSHAAWFAFRRFGEEWQSIAAASGGWLANHPAQPPSAKQE
jgi:hypothetical protein